MKKIIKNISINLRKFRKQKDYKRKQMAKLSNISIYTIINLELGRTPDPKLSTLVKLSDAMEISLDKLCRKRF